MQAATIQIQPQAQKIVANTKWILQVPVLAVDLNRLSKELPTGLQLTKDDKYGIVTVKADHKLKLKRQQFSIKLSEYVLLQEYFPFIWLWFMGRPKLRYQQLVWGL